jgi:hypothetical protein
VCFLHNDGTIGPFRELVEQKLTTSAGYRVTLQTTDLDEPLSLWVNAPKYRNIKVESL